MKTIIDIAHKNNLICKVILETCYLKKDHIEKICEIAIDLKIDFVKTSKGFLTCVPILYDITLIKRISWG